MASQAPEQTRPAPAVSHTNGTTTTKRVAGSPSGKTGKGGWIWSFIGLLLIAAVVGGVYYYFFMPKPDTSAGANGTATGSGGKHGGKGGRSDTVRVVTATATKGD